MFSQMISSSASVEGGRRRAIVLLEYIDQLRKRDGRLAVLTPSSRLRRRPLPLLPRLALVEGGHRQLPTGQEGLRRGILNVCCSCPMVRLTAFASQARQYPARATVRARGWS
jgi:hypothetical protein